MQSSTDALRTRTRESSLDLRRDHLVEMYPIWEPVSLSTHFERCATKWPDRPFFILGDVATTYAQFHARVREFAARLAGQGVKRLDHVGVMLGNSVDFYALKIALARLGARALSINYLLTADELAFILRASNCSTLVYEPTIVDVDAVALINGACAALGADAGSMIRFISVSSPDGPSWTVEQFDTHDMSQLEPVDPVPDHSTPDDIAELIFTSGSSGQPKGVLVRTHNFLGEGYGCALSRGLDDGWISITALPTFHVFGYIEAVMPLSFVGGCLILQRKFDADAQLKAVETYGIDDIVAVPAMTNRLVERAQELRPNLGPLRAIFSAGNAVSPSWWSGLMDTLGVSEVTTGYGLTEAAGTVSMVVPGDSLEMLSSTVGRMKNQGVAGIPELDGMRFRVRIVDHLSGIEVGVGESGEIQLKGTSVMPEYWNMPHETAAAFQDDGWLRTGDRGMLRDDGALVLTGRLKELYKSGGELISPLEVENVLAKLPGVAQVFVVGVPDKLWGEAGCAYIVPTTNSTLDVGTVIAHAKANLARYKVPRHVFFIGAEEVPTSPSGKVFKRGFGDHAVTDTMKEEAANRAESAG